ncbi:MAG: hypothetical protein VB084_06135 [Syntrophomonadaceae bacterium]|nr:hypothetical protein [Syntrophomonadaceae bacterium]
MQRHLRQVKRQLYKNLFKSYQGWYGWHKLVKKYKLGNTAVILMPSCERDYNYNALLYLDQMLLSRKFDNAVILTHSAVVMKSASLFSDKILGVEKFSRKHAEQLMQYYCLYEFDKRLIVASLDEPNGRNGSVLIGKKGTTLEEIFVIGVYRVYPYNQRPAPKYSGGDKEIEQFLNPAGGASNAG